MRKIALAVALALTTGGVLTARESWGNPNRELQEGFKARSTARTSTSGETGALRSAIKVDTTTPEAATVPVGEGLLCLSALGGVYVILRRKSSN